MKWIKNTYHWGWAWLASIIYNHPSRQIFLIGITGTKGKTTSAHLLNHLLKRAGKKTALLSSVAVEIAGKEKINLSGNTMPGRHFIQKWLREAVKAGAEYAVMEVTSQGIEQHRHRFIKWGAAAFTNIHPEHIEAHGSFEKYREAKLKFFRYVSKTNEKAIFFINKKDREAEKFKRAVLGREVIEYGDEEFKEKINKLPGELNKPNALLAQAVVKKIIKNSEEKIKEAWKSFPGVPGRMEIIQTEPFSVVIDYAYTPESVELAYQQLKLMRRGKKAKMICVFGSAGGGRDKWKRPVLGKIAERFCKKIILTTEEPYDEKPEEIIKDIKEGIENKEMVKEIISRREAIREAIREAKEGDVVALLGKGAEPYIHYRDHKEPWDEKLEAREALIRIKKPAD